MLRLRRSHRDGLLLIAGESEYSLNRCLYLCQEDRLIINQELVYGMLARPGDSNCQVFSLGTKYNPQSPLLGESFL